MRLLKNKYGRWMTDRDNTFLSQEDKESEMLQV